MLNINKMVELASKKYDGGVIFLCKKKDYTLLTTRVYPINICSVVIKDVIENVHNEEIRKIILYDKWSFSEVEDINDFIFGSFDTPQKRTFERIASKHNLLDYRMEYTSLNEFEISINKLELDNKLKSNLIDFLYEINNANLFVEKFHIKTTEESLVIESVK